MTIAAAPGAPWREQGGRRVLVCDDERHIVRLIQVNLERQGYSVACAFGGEEAIKLMESAELLNQPGFDLALIDAAMPKVDGYEVLRWIRTREWTRRARVVMMIRAEDREIWEQRPFQADKYLAKPFNPMEIFR